MPPPHQTIKESVMPNFIESLSGPQMDVVAEAERQGYHFIKVFLHPTQVKKSGGPSRFSGCIELKGSQQGIGSKATFVFSQIKGGSFVFNYEQSSRRWVCYMFDDQHEGPYSAVGFNRDMLAGHLGQNWFIVEDPKIFIDLKKRHEWLVSNIEVIRKRKEDKKNRIDVSGGVPTAAENIEDLETKIKFLEDRKNQLQTFQDGKDDEQKELERQYEETKKAEKDALELQLNQQNIDIDAEKAKAFKERAQKSADTRKKNAELKAQSKSKDGNLIDAKDTELTNA